MKIIEFNATTGYTGLLISVRGMYPEENEQKAYKFLSEKAFAIYEKKVKAIPGLPDIKCVFAFGKANPAKMAFSTVCAQFIVTMVLNAAMFETISC